jgi:GNAT superfamily N-acetyltransferase
MQLRPAAPGDELAVARVHIRSWQVGYRGLLPDGFLDGLDVADRARRYTFANPDGPQTTLALRDGAVVGFASILEDTLAALYVDPDAWRSGIGRTLIAHARDALAARGVTLARLWLLAGNERGRQFYEHDGWTATGARRSEVVWGIAVDDLEYQRAL